MPQVPSVYILRFIGHFRIASGFCLSTTYAEAPGWANSDISEILLFLLRALLQ